MNDIKERKNQRPTNYYMETCLIAYRDFNLPTFCLYEAYKRCHIVIDEVFITTSSLLLLNAIEGWAIFHCNNHYYMLKFIKKFYERQYT